MSYTLYTPAGSPRSQPALILGHLLGVAIDVPPFVMGVDNTTPTFRALSPYGRVPTLLTPAGWAVWESPAIWRHLAHTHGAGALALLGRSPADAAAVDCWVSVVTADLHPPAATLVAPYFTAGGAVPRPAAAVAAAATAALHRTLRGVESALTAAGGGGGAFLVGDTLTLADVAAVPALALFLRHTLDAAARAALPSVTAYVERHAAAPAFARVLGALCLCETPLGVASLSV